MPTPFRYESRDNPYADSIGRLLLQRGQIESNRASRVAEAQSRAAEQSGAAWGGAAQSIGQTLAGIPQQITAQKRAALQDDTTTLQNKTAKMQLDEFQRKAEAQKVVDALPFYASGEGRNAMLAALDGPARELAMEHYQKADEAKARLDQITASTNAANLNADESKIKIDAAQLDVFGALASGVKAHNYEPGAFFGAVADAVHKGLLPLEQAGPMVAHGIQNPDWIKQQTDELLARSPEQQKLEETRLTQQRLVDAAKTTADNLAADNARADAAATETTRHNRAMEARPVAGAATGAALTDDGVDYAATQYRLTGKMPSLGNGAGDVKAKIISSAAKQAKDLGQSPVASIQRQAAYAGDAKALSKMQSMSAAAEAFENKAIQQASIVRDLSDKVNRTQFPLLNAAIVAGKADLLGDSNAQLLYNSITTFSSEYAKIMEGSTGSAAGSSDAARKAAERLISAKLSKGTMRDTLDLMQREMQLTIGGYGAVIDHITANMGGTPAAPAATGGAPDLSGLVPGHGRTFSSGPYAGQTWTLGPDGQASRVK